MAILVSFRGHNDEWCGCVRVRLNTRAGQPACRPLVSDVSRKLCGAPIVEIICGRYRVAMHTAPKIVLAGLALLPSVASVQAAEQSRLPADQAVQQDVSRALAKAGIDSRLTSVQVVTTSDHVIHLSGLISTRDTIKLAGAIAAKTAPSWRVVNSIRASFFDDPNHVNGDKTK
jgi:hypothetical protein